MRFLVVYQDYARQAKELVDQLGIRDVSVMVMRKGERAASDEFIAELQAHPNAPTAVCQVVRRFKKSFEQHVDIQFETKKFRPDDKLLAEWLRPPGTEEEEVDAPSTAMEAAADRAQHLVIADGALDSADKVAEHRRKFVNLAADLLARYALGEAVGPLRNWKQNHGVDFAAVKRHQKLTPWRHEN